MSTKIFEYFFLYYKKLCNFIEYLFDIFLSQVVYFSEDICIEKFAHFKEE